MNKLISNKAITTISKTLADMKFNEYCSELDSKIETAMNNAFEGERISQTRMQRIVNRFCDKLGEH